MSGRLGSAAGSFVGLDTCCNTSMVLFVFLGRAQRDALSARFFSLFICKQALAPSTDGVLDCPRALGFLITARYSSWLATGLTFLLEHRLNDLWSHSAERCSHRCASVEVDHIEHENDRELCFSLIPLHHPGPLCFLLMACSIVDLKTTALEQ